MVYEQKHHFEVTWSIGDKRMGGTWATEWAAENQPRGSEWEKNWNRKDLWCTGAWRPGVFHSDWEGGVRQEPDFTPKKRNCLYKQFANDLKLALVKDFLKKEGQDFNSTGFANHKAVKWLMSQTGVFHFPS